MESPSFRNSSENIELGRTNRNDNARLNTTRIKIGNKLLAIVHKIDTQVQNIFYNTLFKLPFINAQRMASFSAEEDPVHMIVTSKIMGAIESIFGSERKRDYCEVIANILDSRTPMDDFVNVTWALLQAYTKGPMAEGSARDGLDEACRTLYSLKAAKIALKGDPGKEDDCNKIGLTKEQFRELKRQFRIAFGDKDTHLSSSEHYLVFVAILYQDVFKMQNLIELVFPDKNEQTLQNHDAALAKACDILLDPKHPLHKKVARKLPLLKDLPPKDIAIIQKMWSKPVSIPQLLQGEASIDSAQGFKREDADANVVDSAEGQVDILKLFTLLDYLDVLGAGGGKKAGETHELRMKRITETAPPQFVYPGFMKMLDIIDNADNQSSIYEQYLERKVGDFKFDITEEAAAKDAARVCCMLRLQNNDSGLATAVNKAYLKAKDDGLIIEQALKRFYYYSPNMFLAAVTGIVKDPKKPTKDEIKKYKTSVFHALRVLASIEGKAKELKIDTSKTLNVQSVADAITAKMGADEIIKNIQINKEKGIVTIDNIPKSEKK